MSPHNVLKSPNIRALIWVQKSHRHQSSALPRARARRPHAALWRTPFLCQRCWPCGAPLRAKFSKVRDTHTHTHVHSPSASTT